MPTYLNNKPEACSGAKASNQLLTNIYFFSLPFCFDMEWLVLRFLVRWQEVHIPLFERARTATPFFIYLSTRGEGESREVTADNVGFFLCARRGGESCPSWETSLNLLTAPPSVSAGQSLGSQQVCAEYH